jgi:hypothetical protein
MGTNLPISVLHLSLTFLSSIKSGGAKLVLWAQTPPINVLHFPYVSKIKTLTYSWETTIVIANARIIGRFVPIKLV